MGGLGLACQNTWLNVIYKRGEFFMDEDKASVDVAKSLPGGQEVIKTSLSFKKGIIAGILILILILAVGLLLGYALGSALTADYYGEILKECQERAAGCLTLA